MFPQFIDQSGSFWGQSVLLSLLYALTLVVIHAGYAAAAAYARHLLTGKRGLLWVNRIGGFFFLAFGLFMLGKSSSDSFPAECLPQNGVFFSANVMVKSDPFPSSLSTAIFHPMRVQIRETSESPIPCP